MRFVLFLLAMVAGLGAMPARAAVPFGIRITTGTLHEVNMDCFSQPTCFVSSEFDYTGYTREFHFDENGDEVGCGGGPACFRASVSGNSIGIFWDAWPFSEAFDLSFANLVFDGTYYDFSGFTGGSYIFGGGGHSFSTMTTGSVSRVAAVPEPATWAMMLLGFGAIGAGLRRRRPVLAHC